MSWDVDLMIDTGGEFMATVADCGNYTYNVNPMYCLAFGRPGGSFSEIIQGRLAAEAASEIAQAIAHMNDPANRAAYTDLNPKNGWGDYEGAKSFLQGILDACVAHPKATIRVC